MEARTNEINQRSRDAPGVPISAAVLTPFANPLKVSLGHTPGAIWRMAASTGLKRHR